MSGPSSSASVFETANDVGSTWRALTDAGNAALACGDASAALSSYEAALDEAERLVASAQDETAALLLAPTLLIVAMLITPGATALLLTDRFGRMLFIAPALAAFACMGSAYASYFLDGSTGGAIVVLQTALFGLAFAFTPKHGPIAARRRRRGGAALNQPDATSKGSSA